MRFLKEEFKRSKFFLLSLSLAVLILSLIAGFGLWILSVQFGNEGDFLSFWLAMVLKVIVFIAIIGSLSLIRKYRQLWQASHRCGVRIDEIMDDVYIFSFDSGQEVKYWSASWLRREIKKYRAQSHNLTTYAIQDGERRNAPHRAPRSSDDFFQEVLAKVKDHENRHN
jgi:hypothetical protein